LLAGLLFHLEALLWYKGLCQRNAFCTGRRRDRRGDVARFRVDEPLTQCMQAEPFTLRMTDLLARADRSRGHVRPVILGCPAISLFAPVALHLVFVFDYHPRQLRTVFARE